MIDFHGAIPFVFMLGSLKMRQDATPEWKPTSADTRMLREGLIGLEVRREEYEIMDCKDKKLVTKHKNWYPFEQYCEKKGIIALEKGQVIVKDIYEWRKICKTKDLMDWQNEQDRESLFAAMPEEREIHESRLKEIREGISKLIKQVPA